MELSLYQYYDEERYCISGLYMIKNGTKDANAKSIDNGVAKDTRI